MHMYPHSKSRSAKKNIVFERLLSSFSLVYYYFVRVSHEFNEAN